MSPLVRRPHQGEPVSYQPAYDPHAERVRVPPRQPHPDARVIVRQPRMVQTTYPGGSPKGCYVADIARTVGYVLDGEFCEPTAARARVTLSAWVLAVLDTAIARELSFVDDERFAARGAA